MGDKVKETEETIENVENEADTVSASPKNDKLEKKKKPSHPRTAEMVNYAILSLKERGGSSIQAIKKYMVDKYKIKPEKQALFIRKYLKSAVASGILVRTKGKGAAGSFKLASVKLEAAKPKKDDPKTTAKKVPASKKASKATKKSGAVKKTVAAATGKKADTTKTSVGQKKAAAAASKVAAAKASKVKAIKSKSPAKTPVKGVKGFRSGGKQVYRPKVIRVAPKKTTVAKKK